MADDLSADFSADARPRVMLPEEEDGGSLTVGSKETDFAGLVRGFCWCCWRLDVVVCWRSNCELSCNVDGCWWRWCPIDELGLVNELVL